MKLIAFLVLMLAASVSAFNTNDYDVDANGNIFKKTKLPKELTSADIKAYKQQLL